MFFYKFTYKFRFKNVDKMNIVAAETVDCFYNNFLISIKKTSNFMNILSKYCFWHKLLKVSGIKFFRNISN